MHVAKGRAVRRAVEEGGDGDELGRDQLLPGAEAVWELPGLSSISCAAVASGLVVLADAASQVRLPLISFSDDSPLHTGCVRIHAVAKLFTILLNCIYVCCPGEQSCAMKLDPALWRSSPS